MMGIVLTDTIWCEAGTHNWQREPKRGRVPKNCPEHQPQAKPTRRERQQIDQSKELERAEERITSLSTRVKEAAVLDDVAYGELIRLPGDDRILDLWMRSNTRLLNEVTALNAARERVTKLQDERSREVFEDDEDVNISVEDEIDDNEDIDDEDTILAEFESESEAA